MTPVLLTLVYIRIRIFESANMGNEPSKGQRMSPQQQQMMQQQRMQQQRMHQPQQMMHQPQQPQQTMQQPQQTMQQTMHQPQQMMQQSLNPQQMLQNVVPQHVVQQQLQQQQTPITFQQFLSLLPGEGVAKGRMREIAAKLRCHATEFVNALNSTPNHGSPLNGRPAVLWKHFTDSGAGGFIALAEALLASPRLNANMMQRYAAEVAARFSAVLQKHGCPVSPRGEALGNPYYGRLEKALLFENPTSGECYEYLMFHVMIFKLPVPGLYDTLLAEINKLAGKLNAHAADFLAQIAEVKVRKVREHVCTNASSMTLGSLMKSLGNGLLLARTEKGTFEILPAEKANEQFFDALKSTRAGPLPAFTQQEQVMLFNVPSEDEVCKAMPTQQGQLRFKQLLAFTPEILQGRACKIRTQAMEFVHALNRTPNQSPLSRSAVLWRHFVDAGLVGFIAMAEAIWVAPGLNESMRQQYAAETVARFNTVLDAQDIPKDDNGLQDPHLQKLSHIVAAEEGSKEVTSVCKGRTYGFLLFHVMMFLLPSPANKGQTVPGMYEILSAEIKKLTGQGLLGVGPSAMLLQLASGKVCKAVSPWSVLEPVKDDLDAVAHILLSDNGAEIVDVVRLPGMTLTSDTNSDRAFLAALKETAGPGPSIPLPNPQEAPAQEAPQQAPAQQPAQNPDDSRIRRIIAKMDKNKPLFSCLVAYIQNALNFVEQLNKQVDKSPLEGFQPIKIAWKCYTDYGRKNCLGFIVLRNAFMCQDRLHMPRVQCYARELVLRMETHFRQVRLGPGVQLEGTERQESFMYSMDEEDTYANIGMHVMLFVCEEGKQQGWTRILEDECVAGKARGSLNLQAALATMTVGRLKVAAVQQNYE